MNPRREQAQSILLQAHQRLRHVALTQENIKDHLMNIMCETPFHHLEPQDEALFSRDQWNALSTIFVLGNYHESAYYVWIALDQHNKELLLYMPAPNLKDFTNR